MTAITLPKRPDLTDIVPLSSSPDGQLNSFCMRCDKQEQTMSYAACLWRQGVLAKPDIRTPSDWAPCGEAARHGACVALMMRQEEVAAEQAIYFRKRNSEAHPMAEPKRSWHSSALAKVGTVVRAAADTVRGITTPAPKPAAPRDALDAMGAMPSYAEAITRMVESGEHTAAAAPAPSVPPTAGTPAMPAPTAMPGESPLAIARRMAAARAAAIAAESK